jgi:hypothetical protein
VSEAEPDVVMTPFGGLRFPDARKVVQIIRDPGFALFHDLLVKRNNRAIRTLMQPSTPPDEALFERGVLRVLQDVHQIVVDLERNLAHALDQQEPVSDAPEGSRSDDDGRDEPGPR